MVRAATEGVMNIHIQKLTLGSEERGLIDVKHYKPFYHFSPD